MTTRVEVLAVARSQRPGFAEDIIRLGRIKDRRRRAKEEATSAREGTMKRKLRSDARVNRG